MKIQRIGIIGILMILVLIQGGWIFSVLDINNHTNLSTTGVLEKVQAISELNTVEMYFHEIIEYEDAKYFNKAEIPFTKKQFIFTVKAKVKAGIDFKDIKLEDINITNKKTVHIKLPPPKITSKEVLEYKPYHEKNSLFNTINNEDTLKVLEQFKKDLEKQAKDAEILQKAKEHAKLSVTQLLTGIGFEDVVVK
ncbi:DUF4230 domain-containing protein [Clostridiaceae bacterium 35-E11]